MRFVLIGLGIALAALAASVGSSNAQGYGNAWCTDGSGRGNGGTLSCAFSSYEQCRATARGLGMNCVRNPDYGRSRGSTYRGQQGY
jgi:hypothetical protein